MLQYWGFPAQGISAILPSDADRSDLTIRKYLNVSAAYPPTGGFGRIAPYAGDAIEIAWLTDDYVSLERTWHCMPCRQSNLHNRTHEQFQWDYCSYIDSPPKVFSMSFEIDKRVVSTPALHTSVFTLKWPYVIEASTLLCAFTIPGVFPDGLSMAFPFINAAPPPGRGQHVFTSAAPRGVPIEMYPYQGTQWRLSFGFFILAFLIGVVIAGAVAGRRFWMVKAAEMLRDGIERARRRGLIDDVEEGKERIGKYVDDE
ncbi:hypothetical protein J1614_003414 [Plenodomus biglobosus]|nr:hypothetical protein J1614_003414 [Plenodomus biglobosus]